MKKLLPAALLLGVLGCTPKADSPEPESTKLPAEEPLLVAADGTEIYGSLHELDGANAIALMFHQAGSNRAEYDPIYPRINERGIDCLIIDQRSGGDMWETSNQTRAQFEEAPRFLDAYPDLEAALAWAIEQEYETIIAWGSSYSASLVFKLASENDEIDVVVAYSPGEYFGGEGLVKEWCGATNASVIMASTAEELESGTLELFSNLPLHPEGEPQNQYFARRQGAHGSSALREDRNPETFEDYWNALEENLERLSL